MKKQKYAKQLENIDTGEIYQSVSYFSDNIIRTSNTKISRKLKLTGACTFIGYTDEPLPIRYLGTDVVIEENTPTLKKRVFTNLAKNVPKEIVSRYVASQWRYENEPEYCERQKKASRKSLNNRYAVDLVYRIGQIADSRINSALTRKGFTHKLTVEEYLGCSVEELIVHLEKQFTDGMTWDNYGNGDGEWHMDHKFPLSWCDTEEELFMYVHYSCIQPLWKSDNLAKSDHFIGHPAYEPHN